MKCKYCHSKKLEYDASTDMYSCNKCRRLLSPEEADELPAIDKEDSSSITEAVPIDEDDLGISTLILLGILGSIPIFDVISTSMVEWSTAKDAYKKTIVSRLIARVFIIMFVIIVGFIICGAYNIELKYNIHDNIMNVLESSRRFWDGDGIEFDLKAKSLEQIKFKYTYTPEEDEDEDFVLKVKWSYLDKSIVTGSTFLNLVEDCSNGNLAYLIQTKQMIEKFDNTTYRSIGTIVTDATREGLNDNWYYKGNVEKKFAVMQDDYNEYISDSLDDLTNKRFIFYIDSSSYFRFNILRDNNEDILGFAITEVGLETSEE